MPNDVRRVRCFRDSGTPDARLPARASGTCKVVGGNPQPLRSNSHAPVGPWPLARITLGL